MNNKSIIEDQPKKVSPVIVVILIMILTVIASIVGFHAGKENMKLVTCIPARFGALNNYISSKR